LRSFVSQPDTGVGLSPQVFAKFTPQLIMNRLPNPFALPLLEVFLDRLMGRKVMGQHLPLAAGALHIEKGKGDLGEMRSDCSSTPSTNLHIPAYD